MNLDFPIFVNFILISSARYQILQDKTPIIPGRMTFSLFVIVCGATESGNSAVTKNSVAFMKQWIHEALSLQITLKVNNPKTETHRLMQIKHICISYKAEFSKMESPLHHSWLMKNHSDFDNSARSAFHSCDQRFMTRLGKSSIWVGSYIAEIDFLGTMVNWSCLILKGDGNLDSV